MSSKPATPSSAKKAVRQKFVAINDVVLLRAVNAFQPWRAPAGTANGILKVFEDIAVHCGADPDFGVDKPGLALSTRFSTLVINFNRDQCRSMRRSGTVEQYQEGDRLLLDILSQTKDWEEKVAVENKIKDAKQQAIESSSALMRRLAMSESIEDSDEGDEDTGGEGTDGADTTGSTAQALALMQELLAVLL
ncbi:unnamed protein product [Phytophthora fragariaefolia]|uniref:Unnamed protein product n=1 Tax=Phytophthora fragariaefolia TaxID=1490495 RepID=A0A9W7CXE0_9STRA|nr:unnamed protein product [Phytophthora fragariaefolia]